LHLTALDVSHDSSCRPCRCLGHLNEILIGCPWSCDYGLRRREAAPCQLRRYLLRFVIHVDPPQLADKLNQMICRPLLRQIERPCLSVKVHRYFLYIWIVR
jgi:hypothetical protein